MSDYEAMARAKFLVRERWGRITPYRLGRMVGEHAIDLQCPYRPRSRGETNYLLGVQDGERKAEGISRAEQ